MIQPCWGHATCELPHDIDGWTHATTELGFGLDATQSFLFERINLILAQLHKVATLVIWLTLTWMNQNPEQIARDHIDRLLTESGWIVQPKSKLNLAAGLGVAVTEYKINHLQT
jgi:hypothetical protein